MCFAVKICFVRARKTEEIDILETNLDVAVGNKTKLFNASVHFTNKRPKQATVFHLQLHRERLLPSQGLKWTDIILDLTL